MKAKVKKILEVSIAAGFFFVFFILSFTYLPKERFAFGMKIAGEDFGGLTKDEAREKFSKKIEEFSEKEILFSFSEEIETKSKKMKMKDIGINFNIDQGLETAFEIGKGKNFFENLRERLKSAEKKYNFPLPSDFSSLEFENFLTENFGEYETLPQNASVSFNEKIVGFEIKESGEGFLFPKQNIKTEIKKEAEFLKVNDVYLSLEKTPPEISTEQAKNAASEAEEIIELSPYLLLAGEKGFILNKEKLGSWFLFTPKKFQDQSVILEVSMDEELIKSHLEELSKNIDIEPINTKLSFEQGSLKISSPSVAGRVLKIEESAKEIKEKILGKENKISLSVEEIKPSVNEEKIAEFSIEALLGSGVSNFSGSPKNRIHNIKTATIKFNGILLGVGEIFSFNKVLGEVGPNQGYLPELVIKKDKTVPEYGGGICQVSTTMFRAAVNSGMEIQERKAHAYPVKYYNPQGFDATVYPPSPDLKFKNNTSSYILIQTRIEGNNLTFEIYGKDDGRKVIVKGPYQYDIKEDGSMKARFEEEVWKDGTVIYKKTFLSSYNSPKLYPVEKNPLE